MKSFHLQGHIQANGLLTLQVPTGLPASEVEVLVVVQSIVPKAEPATPEDLGWTRGFFERTAGAWEGKPLVRGEQGAYEERDELL